MTIENGARFGMLTVIEPSSRRIRSGAKNKPHKASLVRCDCGSVAVVIDSKLKSGHTRSCGCLKRSIGRLRRLPPIPTGSRFSKLVVIDTAEPRILNGRWYAASKVKCDCGKIFCALDSNLRRGYTTSCGCSRRGNIKHGDSRGSGNGGKGRLYRTWINMRRRCSVRGSKLDIKHYYNRGIRVCELWRNSYLAFKQWAMSHGYADNLSIDRIDNNGNYCPENCRWATRICQANNKRSTVYVTAQGETLPLSAWVKRTNLKDDTIRWRLNHNWTPEQALGLEVRNG